MDRYCPEPFLAKFADGLPADARATAERMRAALSLYPCDMLFVHRDAESVGSSNRHRVAELLHETASLRKLPSFQHLETSQQIFLEACVKSC